MSKHTPGPWCKHPTFPKYVIPFSHAGRKIGWAVEKDQQERYAQVIHQELGLMVSPEQAANTQLISAAPQLLIGCISALEILCRLPDEYAMPDHPIWGQLRAAIAKATGETP